VNEPNIVPSQGDDAFQSQRMREFPQSSLVNDHFPFPSTRPAQERALQAFMNAEQKNKRYRLFELPTGVGKCLGPGTLVLMYDGTKKKIEDIEVGETVMGPDSRPRTVLSVTSGEDDMYAVVPRKGERYVVNSQHILALELTRQRSETSSRKPDFAFTHVEISVQEYLKATRQFKHLAKGYRVGVDFPHTPVPLDPYFVGLWLGDGNKDGTEVTTMDDEILDYLKTLAASHGLALKPNQNTSKAKGWRIVNHTRGGSSADKLERNAILKGLQSLNLIRNKHVPSVYAVNDRATRLALLAGYLDADGSLITEKGCFDFISKIPQLADDIAFVARSLGLACYLKPCRKRAQNGFEGTYIRGTISGKIDEIPTKIARKQAGPRAQIKDVLKTGFKIEPLGRGQYFGFMLDGDGLFLLGDFTVTHNSALAYAMGSWATQDRDPAYQPGGYILTTQKTLQQQYLRDFSPQLIELRGASNYYCECHDTDCATGSLLNKAAKAQAADAKASKPKGDDEGRSCSFCPYKEAKNLFIGYPFGVTNFAYFLAETKHVKQLRPRSCLIIDEAHNAESQIINFAEIEITSNRYKEIGLPGDVPIFTPDDTADCLEWVRTKFLPACEAYKTRVEAELIVLKDATDDKSAIQRLAAKIDAVAKFQSRLELFSITERINDWISFTSMNGTLIIKPLTAELFAEDLLLRFGKRVIFMSATILDARAFARSLGIQSSQCGFMRTDSEFPRENRLIHFVPKGRMGYKYINETMPKILQSIEKILRKHENDKGIIHAQSYKLQQAIIDYFENHPYSSRLLWHTNARGSRDEVLRQHLESTAPTVLLSPSMTEGLDLRDDLSRFQVIPKVPFPNLADPFVKAKKDRDPDWYQWQTALTIVQATGRSVRSAEDHCVSYILDSDFNHFLRNAESILPQWWKESIVFHRPKD
jgi:Rad3-related DNA helicase